MSLSVWNRIALWRPAEESLAGWRVCLGDGFEAVKPFLKQCRGVRVKGYFCPTSGTRMVVRDRGEGFVAFATDGESEYLDDLYLNWDDVQAWRLDADALAGGVREALGLEDLGSMDATGAPETVAVGYCRRGRDGERKQVMLCLPLNADEAVAAARGVSASDGCGCVLMADRYAGVREVLASRGMAELLMDDCLRVEDGRICGDCGMACKAVATSARVSVASLGEKLDRGFERVLAVRQDDGQRLRDQRETIEGMAEGPDRFFAGLQGKLDPKERELFFELIDKVQDGAVRRSRSYAEIGERLGGITKQAVLKRADRMYGKHAGLENYVKSIREPGKAANFSELSPTERKKRGIDKVYNYDGG